MKTVRDKTPISNRKLAANMSNLKSGYKILIPMLTSLLIITAIGCNAWNQALPIAHSQVDLQWLGLAHQHLTRKPLPQIEASGTIEAREVAVTAERGGRIVSIFPKEGDVVKQGQVLIRLDEGDLIAQINQARSAVEVAQAELARTQAKARSEEIMAANAALEQAMAQSEGKRRAWQNAIRVRDNPQQLERRMTEARSALALAKHEVEMAKAKQKAAEQARDREKWGSTEYRIAQKRVEAAHESLRAAQATQAGAQAKLAALQAMRNNPLVLEAQVHGAEATYQIAQADVEVAQANLAGLKAPPLAEDIAIAQGKVRRAEAAQHTLEVMRAKMTLYAPFDGIASDRVAAEGELAVPGKPLLTIIDLNQVTLTVYIPERQLGQVRLGQEAMVTVDSFPGRGFIGQITQIADQAEFTPRSVQTKEERVNTVFAVKITLRNPEHLLKPGMPADAVINIEG